MNSKNGELLGNYNVKKLLIRLSVPAIVGMTVNALYNFFDTTLTLDNLAEDVIEAFSVNANRYTPFLVICCILII